MKKSQTLYELIHSLTQNEKRFFKIYSSLHQVGAKNNYVHLFQIFKNQSVYNEEEIIAQTNDTSYGKHLSVEMNYLYQKILECLDIYHKESSVDRQITKYLNIGRVLAEKKLDEQSLKILEKARKLAEFHNRFESVIIINNLQKRKEFSRDTINLEKFNKYYKEINGAIDRLGKAYHYHQIFDELMLLRRREGNVIDQEVLEKVQSIYPNAFDPEPEHFSSFEEEVYFLLSRLEYNRLIPKEEMAVTFTNRLIALFESNPKRITGEYLENYIYVLNVAHLHKNEWEAQKSLNKIRNLEEFIGNEAKTMAIRAKVFEVYYTCISDLANKNKNYKPIIDKLQEIEEGLVTYEKHLTPTFYLVLKCNIACILFGAEKYQESLAWCHQVVNEAPRLRADVYYIMRMLFLMIHFELGNEIILPNLIRSTYHYLGKRKRMYQFETIFRKNLRMLLRHHTRRDKILVLENFKQELEPIKDIPFENLVMREVDILGWIDRKIQKYKIGE